MFLIHWTVYSNWCLQTKLKISCNYKGKIATLSSNLFVCTQKHEFQKIQVHAKRRPRRNDNLELIREVSKISNQYLQE